MASDEEYMRCCFCLAQKGQGRVSPNPMVGCVIVDSHGDVISEGYHARCGENHAERNAILSCPEKDKLQGSTLYVNLEPCSHYGKTPPCADLIVEHGIGKVVISTLDPNPLVAGNGIRKLQDAGIEVLTGVLNREGRFLNRRFFTFMEKKRPYVVLKWAKTSDGFMDIDRTCNPEGNCWITNDLLKILSHRWRTEEDAIMVGTNTVINDNPQLTARLWSGRNPLRVTMDRSGRLPHDARIFDAEAETLLFTERDGLSFPDNVEICKADFSNPIPEMLETLYSKKVQSLIVEGGMTLLDSFLKLNLWDEARVLTGDKVFGKGLSAPVLARQPERTETFENDTVEYYRNSDV